MEEQLLNGRYRLLAQQGSGGMAVIYKATDIALGRTVAVKILRPSLTNDPSFLVRFRQEARNVANLAHPNIVTVHDVGQDGNTHYIVMEFIEGQDLKKIIKADGALPVNRVLDLAIQICAGIGYAHRAGLVHADVKPQNILVSEGERVKVTDFGIAQALAQTTPQERQKIVWGSPHYFSPEQAQGEYPTPSSDVYSIGVVIFEMLTGRLPFMANDQQELALAHIRDAPPRISELNQQVPTSLDRIIQKALAKEPSARYRTADQLGRILIAYKEQGQEPTAGVKVIGTNVAAPASGVPNPHLYGPSQPARHEMTEPTLAPHAQTQPPAYGYAGNNPGYGYVEQPGYTYAMPPEPEIMRSRGYRVSEPPSLDLVTLVLAVIALIAMVGVVILWIFVWQAYSG